MLHLFRIEFQYTLRPDPESDKKKLTKKQASIYYSNEVNDFQGIFCGNTFQLFVSVCCDGSIIFVTETCNFFFSSLLWLQ